MSRKGWALFAAMCLVWGIPYVFIKIAVAEVAVPVVVFARTALGAALLVPLALRSGQLAVLRRHWRPLAAFAVLEMIVPWGLLSQAERKLPSSLAGLLIAAVPIVSVVIARLTGGTERLSPRRWTGLIIGLAGVAVLAVPDLAGGSALPVAEVLLVALGYATAPLIAARKLADVPALPMTAACLTLATLVWLPPAVLAWPHRMPSAKALAALAVLGVVCTACAFIIFLALIRTAGPSRAMVFTYVNPAVAVAAGVAFLAEPFTVTIAVSFTLILAGCLLATGSRPDPAAPAGQEAEVAELQIRGLVGADGPGLDLDHEVRPGQRSDLDGGAGRRPGRVHVLVTHRAHHRDLRDVGEVEVQLDHVGKRGPGRGQRPVQVGEDLPDLRLHVTRPDQFAVFVEGDLAGDGHPAAAAGHRVAVARTGRQPVRSPEML